MNIRHIILQLLMLAAIPAHADVISTGTPQKINSDWLFQLGDPKGNPSSPAFNDSDWRKLSLPHDWSIEHEPSPELNSCTGYLPGGIGWYRKHIEIADTTRPAYLYFEGVYNRSEVYVNGKLAGKRPNGYISFYYDITPLIKQGENVIAVRADHSREADSRWYTGSGIYRDVWLVTAPENHFEPWGLFWKLKEMKGKDALIVVENSLAPGSAASDLKMQAIITDKEGTAVATASSPIAPAKPISLELTIKNAELWSPDSPALYNLETQLIQDGSVIDRATSRIGIRSLRFDPDRGFFLNGENMKMKGVCLHHDAGVFGAAVPEEVMRRRIKELKKIGVNAIRLSHNPQSPYLYDLCDELGMMVMDEASDEWEFPKRKWVTGWNHGTPKFEGSYDFFEEWIDRDVADMVRRDRNHPSIVLWSIGNEVDYPNDPYSHPVLDNASINQHNYGGYNPDAPDARRIGEIAHRLSGIVRGIDDSRPVTGALAGVVMSNETTYPQEVDVVGYNYTEDRYQTDHKLYPQRIIYGSENTHGYREWLAVKNNPHIFGQFLWTGADYLGESHEWPSRGLGTGLLDFASLIKPRGKFRESLWSDKPVAWLGTYALTEANATEDPSIDAPATWNYPEGTKVRVVAYTNGKNARLLLNGREIGSVKPFDESYGMIFWDVNYQPGELRLEAYDDGKLHASDTLVTSGKPYALKATLLDKSTALAQILVEVVDKSGNRVPYASDPISCVCEGDGSLIALEGTGNTDMSHPKAKERKAFEGKCVAYIGIADPAKPLTVRFTSPSLKSASLTLSPSAK